jgi:hypothetical protein
VPDPGARALAHLLRAAQELALALAAGASALGGRGPALESVREALRAEEKRWAERAAHDPAAARVREVFAALADVLEPSSRARPSARPKAQKFDPPKMRWDTRKPWRS